jgi:hypothetical protein
MEEPKIFLLYKPPFWSCTTNKNLSRYKEYPLHNKLHRPKRKMRNQKCVKHIFDYSKKSFAFLRTEKCKTILSGDVNAPSVRACFHLTAFYSG